MREQLLGYLLDALDDDERAAVEQALVNDPTWRAELQQLQALLDELGEHTEPLEPPAGLASRACELVEACREAERVERVERVGSGQVVPSLVGSLRNRWGVADSVVMAGILLIATMLFFPAIANSRYAARIATCQNNLRQLGFALASYSDKAGIGYFPAIPHSGPRAFAGFYAPVLWESGYLDDPQLLVCPSSELAFDQQTWIFPTIDDVDRATPEQLSWIRQIAGGSYGYNLGVVIDGVHHAARNLGRASFALMADAPQPRTGHDFVENHLGTGRNVLYEDGHVRFLPVKLIERTWPDHPFMNRQGLPEAGVDANDAVVGPSAAPPFLGKPPSSSTPSHPLG